MKEILEEITHILELVKDIRYDVKASLNFQKSKEMQGIKRLLDDYDEKAKEREVNK